jgi:hypothetical protein
MEQKMSTSSINSISLTDPTRQSSVSTEQVTQGFFNRPLVPAGTEMLQQPLIYKFPTNTSPYQFAEKMLQQSLDFANKLMSRMMTAFTNLVTKLVGPQAEGVDSLTGAQGAESSAANDLGALYEQNTQETESGSWKDILKSVVDVIGGLFKGNPIGKILSIFTGGGLGKIFGKGGIGGLFGKAKSFIKSIF